MAKQTDEQALQERPYTPYGGCRETWEAQDFEVLVVGPAGTGKTRGDLEKMHLACMKYPGCRALIVRKTRRELTETALPELEDHVFPRDWRTWGGKARRNQRDAYHYPNGSIMVVGGMDDPMKVLSSEWDRILVVEAVQLFQDDYEMLTSRCRATNTPYQQVICETNPNVPSHWLLKRAKAGKMRYIQSTHKDNPKYWDQKKQEWTKAGRHYIDVVLGNLTGNRRRRLLDGVWCADEQAVFDTDVLERHLELCTPPKYYLRLRHMLDGRARDISIAEQAWHQVLVSRIKPVDNIQGVLLWWGDLEEHSTPDGRKALRPPQDRTYVLSADISGGNGASNSVIAIGDRQQRRKVGEYVNASISPAGLARVMAMLGLWAGGRRRVGHLVWEANYPGPYFGRQLSQVLMYPSLYRRDKGPDTAVPDKGQQLGWFNSPTAKRDMAEALRDAYAQDEFTNPSEAAIQEAMQWVRYENGKIGPGFLAEESEDARATHGDRVIADGLLNLGFEIPMPAPPPPPKNEHWTAERVAFLRGEEEDPDDAEANDHIDY